MRRFSAVDTYARWLMTALGVVVPACGGSSDTSNGGVTNPHPCKDPQPIVVGGKDTGVDTCGSGSVRRRDAMTCPEAMPRVNPCSAQQMNCSADTDCTAQAHGYCSYNQGGGGAPPSCNCAYGCTTDAECQPGFYCLCGDPVGTCVQATCATGADCEKGFDCVSPAGSCSIPNLACQSTKDECVSDEDCTTTGYCGVDASGHHVCTLNGCAGMGRPFLVGGAPRLAPLAARKDYQDRAEPSLDGTSTAERALLAEHFARVGLMEHASVAAFARFALQLLALGAPADLVQRSNRAQADESEHAAIAFSFASAYAGSALGPGPLDMSGALPALEPRQVLADVIREGCIGETLAAVEAQHGAEHAADPVVRAALERIARDESEHAALAWHFVTWICDEQPELADFVNRELARASDEVRRAPLPPAEAGAGRKRELGMLDERERAELRRDAVTRVVSPCAAVLLGDPRRRHAPRAEC